MCDKVAVIKNGKIVKVENMTDVQETPTETVEIRVKNIERASSILREKFQLEPQLENNNILVMIITEKIPEVVRELAIENVEVKAIIPREHTLEDIFFDATEGGNNE